MCAWVSEFASRRPTFESPARAHHDLSEVTAGSGGAPYAFRTATDWGVAIERLVVHAAHAEPQVPTDGELLFSVCREFTAEAKAWLAWHPDVGSSARVRLIASQAADKGWGTLLDGPEAVWVERHVDLRTGRSVSGLPALDRSVGVLAWGPDPAAFLREPGLDAFRAAFATQGAFKPNAQVAMYLESSGTTIAYCEELDMDGVRVVVLGQLRDVVARAWPEALSG